MKKHIKFENSVNAVANTLGFDSYLEAVAGLYAETGSSKKVAERLGVTGPAVIYRLKQMGVPLKSPGGANNPHGYSWHKRPPGERRG